MSQIESTWSDSYKQMVDRNVGFISAEQQEKLRSCKVAVLGAGGIGGTAFEILVRAGIGRFSIVDRDTFEPTNLNRQILATRHTLGQRKIDVAAARAKEINPDVLVEKFDHIDEANIGEILENAAAAVMGIDSLGPCIIASRKCRELNIPLVEGWALPYGDVRVFSTKTPSLEEVYELGTEGRHVNDIPESDLKHLGLKVFGKLGQIDGVPDYYSPEVIEGFGKGRIVSFAPMVWLTAVLMALETIKVLLNWGKLALAPTFALYDPFLHRIPTSQG
jgi:molybdopterin/thiamine biosynthesis adenylyltransferase